MTEFVSGASLTANIRKLLANGSPAELAVAFWGHQAIELLGLPKKLDQITILCDLRSGACNPHELKRFLKRGAKIWTKNGLHAKVFVTAEGAVIGSANASANGLGEEGAEIDLALEAGVATADKAIVTSARNWFKQHLLDADKVDVELIDQYKPVWQERVGRTPSRGLTLLQILRQDPVKLAKRPIRVIAYEYEETTPADRALFKKMGSELYGPQAFKRINERGEYPFYVDNKGTMDVSPGDWFLDYVVGGKRSRTVKFQGIWQILPDKTDWKMPVKAGQKRRLIFLKRHKTVDGIKFPVPEQREVGGILKRHLAAVNPAENKNGDLVEIPAGEIDSLVS